MKINYLEKRKSFFSFFPFFVIFARSPRCWICFSLHFLNGLCIQFCRPKRRLVSHYSPRATISTVLNNNKRNGKKKNVHRKKKEKKKRNGAFAWASSWCRLRDGIMVTTGYKNSFGKYIWNNSDTRHRHQTRKLNKTWAQCAPSTHDKHNFIFIRRSLPYLANAIFVSCYCN